MEFRNSIGNWRIDANGYVGTLQLWSAAGVAAGRAWLEAHQVWEALTAVAFDANTDELAFTRGTQRDTGKLAFDNLRGQFTDGAQTYDWHAERAWTAEARQKAHDRACGSSRRSRVHLRHRASWCSSKNDCSVRCWLPMAAVGRPGRAGSTTCKTRAGTRTRTHMTCAATNRRPRAPPSAFRGAAALPLHPRVLLRRWNALERRRAGRQFPAAGTCSFNDVPSGGQGELDYFSSTPCLRIPSATGMATGRAHGSRGKPAGAAPALRSGPAPEFRALSAHTVERTRVRAYAAIRSASFPRTRLDALRVRSEILDWAHRHLAGRLAHERPGMGVVGNQRRSEF